MHDIVNSTEITKQILYRFQDGYTHREISRVDSYMEELFIKDGNTVILGTSSGELCMGFEEAKELVRSDWEYWGDVVLDVENTLTQAFGDVIWFAVPGTAKYTFKDSEDKWERYVGFVEDMLKNADKGPMESLTMINWGLSHALLSRDDKERSYGWPLRLTGALVKEGQTWKFQYMQFSIPSSIYPDIRTGTETLDNLYEKPAFKTSNFTQGQSSDEIKSVIREFVTSFTSGDTDSIHKYLELKEESFIIGPQEPWLVGSESIKTGIGILRDRWGQLKLDLDNSLVFCNGPAAWVCCTGEMNKEMDNDEALHMQVKDIEGIVTSTLHPKEKLFNIQRNIIATLKEMASGPARYWPCRFEAMLAREEKGWYIQSMQISFPFYYVLEDKIRAVRL